MKSGKTQGKSFKDVPSGVGFPELEEKQLAYWKKEKTFEKSVKSRSADKTWTFLDGPPFITGLPHYGSLLSSIPKDVFPRYWTMKGYRVRRVWGWDCHGLPAENKVENKLGLKRKKDIEEKVGVKKFIDECKLYVSEVSSEWKWYVDHIARWVDFENAYKTMDTNYMESVMWVFKQMYEKGFIYKGLRVSLYCPHCSTPISNFEVAMDADNYKDVTEVSNTYKYQVKGQKDTYLLAWSTTPWNKIATPALAVNPKLTYVKVEQGKEKYILAQDTLKVLNEKPKYKVIEKMKGNDLVGMEFVPHYDFYEIEEGKRAFVIIPGDFVTADEGTGIVTIAAYGEEDLAVMQKENIQTVLHVDEEGILTKDVPQWAGMHYMDVNDLVNEDLASRNLMYKEESHTHSVAHCWRCGTRLIYSPQNAWYVDIQKLKPQLVKTNKNINWFPEHFKEGRFQKSVEAAPDWCISRSRYWGSPVPVWECECGDRFVAGSIEELEKASGKKIEDLHKPEIDDIIIKCKKCGKEARRVPEVLDSWIEAGSAAFAERHFPFDTSQKLEDFFPPEFIVEYTGQIRAWFYVLHVISNAIYETEGFKNVVVTGVIQGTDGRKMSKNFGNYPDPKEMIQRYGGDALRLYLLGTPVMKGEDIRISEEEYLQQVKGFMLLYWNVYKFFVMYANIDGWKPEKKSTKSSNVLDQWILSRLASCVLDVSKALEGYNTPDAVAALKHFVVKDLSGWYVRRSRDRVGPSAESVDDKANFYSTLYKVLTMYTKALAPIAPFISEEVYRNLTGEESVHLSAWPDLKELKQDKKLDEAMETARKVAEEGHSLRKTEEIAVKQALLAFTTSHDISKVEKEILVIVSDELNVKAIKSGKKAMLDTTMTKELEEEGKTRELIRQIQNERKNLNVGLSDKVKVTTPWLPESKENREYLTRRALVSKLTEGAFSVKKS